MFFEIISNTLDRAPLFMLCWTYIGFRLYWTVKGRRNLGLSAFPVLVLVSMMSLRDALQGYSLGFQYSFFLYLLLVLYIAGAYKRLKIIRGQYSKEEKQRLDKRLKLIGFESLIVLLIAYGLSVYMNVKFY